MFRDIKQSFLLLDKIERTSWVLITFARIVAGILDLIGILLVGLLLAKSSEITGSGSSSPSNFGFKFMDHFSTLSILNVAQIALVVFISKSLLSVFLLKSLASRLANAESTIAKKLYAAVLGNSIPKMQATEVSYSLTFSLSYALINLLTVTSTVITETILLIGISVVFAIVDFEITLAILVYFAIIGIVIHRVVGRQFQKSGRDHTESVLSASRTIEDSIKIFKEIQTQKKQNEFLEKFSDTRNILSKANANIGYISSLPRYIVESALMLGAIGLVFLSFSKNNSGDASATLGIFLTGSLRIMASMLPLQSSLGILKQLISQSRSFFTLLNSYEKSDKQSEFETPTITNSNENIPASFKLKNVSFKYPNSENYALKNITMEIDSGQQIALIGPSGAGKSTLADLLAGVLTQTEGEILIDGIKQKSPRIGYVTQNPNMISGTIMENITLNVHSKNYYESNLNYAIQAAQLGELINYLHDGIFSTLGPQSDSLSGGQIQRIGLARALYQNPNLLILDEATSALDVETESVISNSLLDLKGLCTVIVIAHRLSTVQNADKVFVIDEGKIVAEGKFAELAKSNELVARYVELSGLETN